MAIFDTRWHVTSDVVVDGTKGLKIIAFPDPSKTGVVSVNRVRRGHRRAMGYVVY